MRNDEMGVAIAQKMIDSGITDAVFDADLTLFEDTLEDPYMSFFIQGGATRFESPQVVGGYAHPEKKAATDVKKNKDENLTNSWGGKVKSPISRAGREMIEAMFKTLKNAGKRIHIATMNRYETIESIMRAEDLLQHVDNIAANGGIYQVDGAKVSKREGAPSTYVSSRDKSGKVKKEDALKWIKDQNEGSKMAIIDDDFSRNGMPEGLQAIAEEVNLLPFVKKEIVGGDKAFYGETTTVKMDDTEEFNRDQINAVKTTMGLTDETARGKTFIVNNDGAKVTVKEAGQSVMSRLPLFSEKNTALPGIAQEAQEFAAFQAKKAEALGKALRTYIKFSGKEDPNIDRINKDLSAINGLLGKDEKQEGDYEALGKAINALAQKVNIAYIDTVKAGANKSPTIIGRGKNTDRMKAVGDLFNTLKGASNTDSNIRASSKDLIGRLAAAKESLDIIQRGAAESDYESVRVEEQEAAFEEPDVLGGASIAGNPAHASVGAVTPPKHDSDEAAKGAWAAREGANIVYGDGGAGDDGVAYNTVIGVMKGNVRTYFKEAVEEASPGPEDSGANYAEVILGGGGGLTESNTDDLALAGATADSTNTDEQIAIYGNDPIVEAHNAETAATESPYGNASAIKEQRRAKAAETPRREPPPTPQVEAAAPRLPARTSTAPSRMPPPPTAVTEGTMYGEKEGVLTGTEFAFKMTDEETKTYEITYTRNRQQKTKKITGLENPLNNDCKITGYSPDKVTITYKDGPSLTCDWKKSVHHEQVEAGATPPDMEAGGSDALSMDSLSGGSGASTPRMPSPSIAVDVNQNLSTGQVQVSDGQKEELDKVFTVKTPEISIEPGRLKTLGLDGKIKAISFVKNSNLDYGQDTGNSSFFVLVDEAGNMAVSNQPIRKLNQSLIDINDMKPGADTSCNLKSATVDGLAEALTAKTTVAKETLVEKIKEERGKIATEIARAGQGAGAGR